MMTWQGARHLHGCCLSASGTIADRNGVLEDKPRKIKAQVLPYDDTDVLVLLAELVDAGFISRFTTADNDYLSVENFSKHQNPHKKEEAKHPQKLEQTEMPGQAPDLPETSPGQAPDKNSASPADSCTLIPDSGYLKPEKPQPGLCRDVCVLGL